MHPGCALTGAAPGPVLGSLLAQVPVGAAFPSSAFTRVDFPTFERPTKATCESRVRKERFLERFRICFHCLGRFGVQESVWNSQTPWLRRNRAPAPSRRALGKAPRTCGTPW